MSKEIPHAGPESDEVHPEYKDTIEKLVRSHGKEGGKGTIRGLSKKEVLEAEDAAVNAETDRLLGRIKRKPKVSEKSEAQSRTEIGEATEEPETFEELSQKAYEERMDQANVFWENIERGSAKELLYRVIEEEFIEFRVNINEGSARDDLVIETTPYETDKETLYAITQNPIVQALTIRPGPVEKNILNSGLKLEEEKMLPKDTTKRALAHFYSRSIDQFRKYMRDTKSSIGKRRYAEQIKIEEEALRKLGVEPLADEEVRVLFRRAIQQEIENSLQ